MKNWIWFTLARVIFKIFFSLKIEGLDNLTKNNNKPLLLVCNHLSYLDGIILLLASKWRFYFLVDKKVAKVFPFSFFIKQAKTITIDSFSPFSIRDLVFNLKQNKYFVLFPEGRISTTGSLMEIQDGAALVAIKTKAAILPIYIKDAHRTYFSKTKGLFARRWYQPIKVRIGNEFTPKLNNKLSSKEKYRKVNLALAERFYKLSFEMENLNLSLFEVMLQGMKNSSAKKIIAEDINLNKLSYKKLIISSIILGSKLFKNQQIKENFVGFLLPNSLAALVLFFSFQLYHKTAVILNFSSGFATIVYSCKLSRIKTIVTSRTFIELAELENLIKELSNFVKIIYLEDLRKTISFSDKIKALLSWDKVGSLHRSLAQFSATKPAVVLFTSGSSGKPKAVVLSHRNIVANYYQFSSTIDINQQDIILNVLPVFHSFGLVVGMLTPIFASAKVCLYHNPLQYRLVATLAYNFNATFILGTPTFFRGYALKANDNHFYKVRYAVAGAEKLSKDIRDLWLKKFGIRILEGYGMTEAAPVISTNTNLYYKENTVGRFIPGIEYKLKKAAGITSGKKLYLKGPNLMLGYLKSDESGQIDPLTGWYDTGDLVNIDDEGFITIVGRQKRFCKIAGEMISLPAVENLINNIFPGSEIAVIAVSNSKKGESLVLATSDAKITKAIIRKYIIKNAENILYLPQSILKLSELPLLGSRKIDYPKIAEIYYNSK